MPLMTAAPKRNTSPCISGYMTLMYWLMIIVMADPMHTMAWVRTPAPLFLSRRSIPSSTPTATERSTLTRIDPNERSATQSLNCSQNAMWPLLP